MRVAVTGATGFLGRHVARELAVRGHDVIAVARSSNALGVGADFVATDLTRVADHDDLMTRLEADWMIHLAWHTEHGKYWNSPMNETWKWASASLADKFLKSGGKHFVGVGTCAEYQWSGSICQEGSTPLEPESRYGVAKRDTEREISKLLPVHAEGFGWARVFFPYGPGDNPARLTPSLIRVFTEGEPVFATNVLARRDFVHATDVARALCTLVEQGARGPFNISTGSAVSVSDVIRSVAKALGCDPTRMLLAAMERPEEPAVVVGDPSRLRALGWAPRFSLEDGIASMVAHELEPSI